VCTIQIFVYTIGWILHLINRAAACR